MSQEMSYLIKKWHRNRNTNRKKNKNEIKTENKYEQYLDLTRDDNDYMLEQSIKAEEVLKKFIN